MFALGWLLVGAGAVLVNAGITNRSVFDLLASFVAGTRAPRLDAAGGVIGGAAQVPSGAVTIGPRQLAGVDHIDGRPLAYVPGQPGFRLRVEAVEAFQRAQVIAGGPIRLSSAYRTRAEQEAAYRDARPGYAAVPGRSLHERGLAIDVVAQNDPRVSSALTQTGWRQFDAAKEPWHWSYGIVG